MNLIPKFPAVWSSTMHADWKECKHQFYLRHILGLVPKGAGIHLHAGACFARGLEVARRLYYSGSLSKEDAVAMAWAAAAHAWGPDPIVPDDHVKSLPRVQQALIAYFDKWDLERDDSKPVLLQEGHAVECSFSLPLDIAHPDTGEQLVYAGTFDMLAECGGLVYVHDEKTASQLGPTWAEKWPLRGQFISYVWGAKNYGYPIAGVQVRGVAFYKNDYGFAETKIPVPQWRVNEWLDTLYSDIADAIAHWKRGYWPKVYGDPCSGFGGCPYRTLCLTPNPFDYVDAYYEVKYYDPLRLKD